jgi:sulfate/thiosulfate transport system substrate-binding protein
LLRKLLASSLVIYLGFAAWWVISAGVVRDDGPIELLNVACDPTRELWRDLNARFLDNYEREFGMKLSIRQSHGGSGSQARAVIDGLDADVATLALFTDTDAIRKAGRIDDGWEQRLPNRSLPYISTIVFVVRNGNPKRIRDWRDLLRDDVGVITPNPKTSGNGKWSFLAMWGAVSTRGGSDAEALEAVTAMYRRVPVLDPAARGATMTFAQKKIGDVHLTWENEARLEVQEAKGELEIVYPPVSVLAEPHVAIVDAVVRRKGTKAAAEAYMKYLYTDEAQRIIASHHYRPTSPAILRETADRFPAIKLFPARALGPDWDSINKRFFAEGGVFDQIYAARRPK